jgi:hypothetical protein
MKNCSIGLPILSVFLFFCLFACGGGGDSGGEGDTYDVAANGIPQFVYADYIEADKIEAVSKFRSGVGHDYSDDFESCRSMKHYFRIDGDIDWATVRIFSPIDGVVHDVFDEWAGTQVQIKSEEYPAFYLILFHVNLDHALHVGDMVDAGQELGAHIGSQTMSDIAVRVNTPGGSKLVSYFDVIGDDVFSAYQTRGLNSREDVIISKGERDADPLGCVQHEAFDDSGSLENWVTLN